MPQTRTADDIRSEINAGFDAYIAELQQAGAHWERKPAAGEGEDAWCARQVAEHIAGAGLFFGAGIAQAIGVAGPALARFELTSAGDGVAKTRESHEALMGVVAQVTDQQLPVEIDHPRLGKQTVASMLGIVSHHLVDHCQQLKSLREG